MVSSKNLNRIERKSILLFLFYSFLIAWGTEGKPETVEGTDTLPAPLQ